VVTKIGVISEYKRTVRVKGTGLRQTIFIHEELLHDDMIGAWCGVLREQFGILDLFFYEAINTQRLLPYILTPIYYRLCPFQQGSEQLTDKAIRCAEIFALMDYYVAYGDNYLPTFRENLPIPSSRVKKSKKLVSSSRTK
jgi:hypothetical protein